MDNRASPNRRRSPGGVAEAHPSVAGRRSRVLMAEHRGQLAKTQNSKRAPSSTTRFGGMLKKSVAALALRAMKLNRARDLERRVATSATGDSSDGLPQQLDRPEDRGDHHNHRAGDEHRQN